MKVGRMTVTFETCVGLHKGEFLGIIFLCAVLSLK